MNRRGFLMGMAGILATATAPAIVRAASIMPVMEAGSVWLPTEWEWSKEGIFVPGELVQPITIILEASGQPATIKTIGALWKRIDGLEWQPSIISVVRP
jgi:hypothetical protein